MISQNISANTTFCSRKRNNSERNSFELINDAIDTTSKTIEDFDEFIQIANSTVDMPEDVAMRTIKKRLHKVANNESAPTSVKKAAKYACAAVITAISFIATKKLIKAPERIISISKNYLNKSATGKNIVNFFSNLKEKGENLANNLKNSKLGDLKKYFGEKYAQTTNFITKKFPKFVRKFTDFKRFLKIDKWNKNDYIKNGFSAFIALSSGIGYLRKQNNKENQPLKEAA